MNINAVLRGFYDSADLSMMNLKRLVKKLDDETLLISCPYQLYKAIQDLLDIQEKIEFFLRRIEGCDYSIMSEKDFSVYMEAMAGEFLRKSEFLKRYVNDSRMIK